MSKKISLIFIFALILIAAGAVYFFYPNFSGDNNADTGELDIRDRFDNKIVYTLDVDQSSTEYKNHCRAAGGDFNACGSPCGPEAEVCTTVCAFTCENTNENKPDDNENISEYNNYRYGFGIEYNAKDWQISEAEDEINSVFINIYKKNEDIAENLPLSHFANASHVSFYPRGIPTEGISAQTADFNLEIEGISSENSQLYVLKDGTPFAAMLIPQERPESWNESGYIWIRTFVNDMESECLRDGIIIDSSECNPLSSGDNIIISGTVDENIWQKEIDMLKTLMFLRNNQDDLIYLESPLANEQIESPLEISGQARGQWFFEANFSAVLVDWDGRIIAETGIGTDSDWMTEDYVPFSSQLEFDSPYSESDPSFMKKGSLILQKANPSGLPENDNALEIGIEF